MEEKLKEKVLAHYVKLERAYNDDTDWSEYRCGGSCHPAYAELEAWAAAHPGADVWEQKAAQYRILAERMDTVVFPETPFYFISDLCFRDGTPRSSVGGWLPVRNTHVFRDADPETYELFGRLKGPLRAFSACGPFGADRVHFCWPVGNVIRMGLRGALEKVRGAMPGANGEEMKFLRCAETGLLAAKRIAERFREKAEALLPTVTDPARRRNLELLIAAAGHAPWEPCGSFFEGLNTMWFCRNVMGVIDGIGNSHLGRPDADLIGLYRRDLAAGRLDEAEALRLVRQFVLLGDNQYDKNVTVRYGADHEMEMGLVLGGCDAEGKPVYNEVTRLFLRAHRDVNAIYPKLHCRWSSDSPADYLKDLADDFLAGRSVLGLSCDDAYLPALLHDGVSLTDARNYVNTGCWSSISEGNESVPGGNYFYLVPLMAQMVYTPAPEFARAGIQLEPLDGAGSFEELYRIMMGNYLRVMRFRNDAIGKYGPLAAAANPLCLASAFMNGCVESRRDFTQGGGKYNRNTVDIAGLANFIDALLAMKTLCFDEKRLSLREYLDAVRANWAGNEALLAAARRCPHYGDQSPESMALIRRVHEDFAAGLEGQRNERGGHFSLNYYVYREFLLDAAGIPATPDGRRDGEYYALGVGPNRWHADDPLTAVVQTAGSLDPEKADVTALDLRLPAGQLDREKLAALLHTFAYTGVKHLQLNVTDAAALRDAQLHPEKYPDLIVRVCGFSAKFTVLDRRFQDEVIRRTEYGVS